MSLAEDLKKVVKGDVVNDDATLETYSRDASLLFMRPEIVVRPTGVEDLQALVRFVAKEKKKGSDISLTPRSAGTDMGGGPLTTSIVVDMLPHFNSIIDVSEKEDREHNRAGYAVVEPGVFYRDFDAETQKKGLELPSYTASRDLNTVGGMASNDSGGEKSLKYGKTSQYVEELEMVLSDGEVHTFKALSGSELQIKLQEDSFEGEIYRAISTIVAENRDTIEHAKPHVQKNSSGYALWDIGDGVSALNIARLVVGSQGTFGIITKIKFSLVRPKKFSSMAVVFVNSIEELGALIPRILSHKPDSFESYDDNTFKLAARYFPEFALQMKTNLLGLGLAFLPEVWRLVTSGVPKIVLLVEFQENKQEESFKKARALIEDLKQNESSRDIGLFLAKNEKEGRKYWTIRHESFNLLRKKVRGKRTAPFIEDFVVVPAVLPEFLPKLNAILNEYDLTYTIAGHVGDGNFHIIPLIDPMRPDGVQLVRELSERVYDLILKYDGSITGEHNDGFIRTPYIERMFGKDMTALFEQAEASFDPLDIFNPNKKVIRGDIDPLDYLDLNPQK